MKTHSTISQSGPGNIEPAAMSIPDWCRWSGHGRTKTYELIKAGEIEAVKAGSRTLVITESGKRYLGRLPRVHEAA